MSRMTRQERATATARPARKLTFREAVGKVRRAIKRRLVAEGHIVDPANRPPRFRWTWVYQDKSDVVLADTRSQAKAIIKRALGLAKGHRLPAEVQITGEPTVANTN